MSSNIFSFKTWSRVLNYKMQINLRTQIVHLPVSYFILSLESGIEHFLVWLQEDTYFRKKWFLISLQLLPSIYITKLWIWDTAEEMLGLKCRRWHSFHLPFSVLTLEATQHAESAGRLSIWSTPEPQTRLHCSQHWLRDIWVHSLQLTSSLLLDRCIMDPESQV